MARFHPLGHAIRQADLHLLDRPGKGDIYPFIRTDGPAAGPLFAAGRANIPFFPEFDAGIQLSQKSIQVSFHVPRGAPGYLF
jgi:hypothetical protein